MSAAVRSTARAASLKGGSATCRDVVEARSKRFDCGRAFRAPGSRLDRDEVRTVAHQAHIGVEFALKHLPDEYRGLAGDDVADQDASKARGELGGIVAGLVRVPEDH